MYIMNGTDSILDRVEKIKTNSVVLISLWTHLLNLLMLGKMVSHCSVQNQQVVNVIIYMYVITEQMKFYPICFSGPLYMFFYMFQGFSIYTVVIYTH